MRRMEMQRSPRETAISETTGSVYFSGDDRIDSQSQAQGSERGNSAARKRWNRQSENEECRWHCQPILSAANCDGRAAGASAPEDCPRYGSAHRPSKANVAPALLSHYRSVGLTGLRGAPRSPSLLGRPLLRLTCGVAVSGIGLAWMDNSAAEPLGSVAIGLKAPPHPTGADGCPIECNAKDQKRTAQTRASGRSEGQIQWIDVWIYCR
jgi:hypothetical protein